MSFQQGLSGLNSTSKNLNVIGNNIANANTFGSKASRAEFADVYANAINGGGASAVGIGVSVAAVSQQFTQGNIVTTESALDLALNGNGFFQLDGGGSTLYTRNGQFQIDKLGNLTNAQGRSLLGYAADASGTIIPSSITPIQLPTAGVAPAATTSIDIEMNLDAQHAVTAPSSGPAIDFNAVGTYNNATSLTVFDDKGQAVALTFYFQKAATDTWNVYVRTPGGSILTDGTGAPQRVTQMVFNANGGSLSAPTSTVSIDIPAITLPSGGTSLTIPGIALDLTSATQYGAAFSITDLSQDGYAPGQLTGVNIDASGVLKAQYSNGQDKAAGQVVLASFRNPQGLQPLGGNAWSSSFASGDPVVGAPGQGNFGVLQSGALEESNVDLTGELVAMITAQRSYQANAQTIRTEDEVLQTLVNLR
ncbi:MAG: flagellar hook protein FlgE [Aquabacterium sp.]